MHDTDLQRGTLYEDLQSRRQSSLRRHNRQLAGEVQATPKTFQISFVHFFWAKRLNPVWLLFMPPPPQTLNRNGVVTQLFCWSMLLEINGTLSSLHLVVWIGIFLHIRTAGFLIQDRHLCCCQTFPLEMDICSVSSKSYQKVRIAKYAFMVIPNLALKILFNI